MSVIKTIGTGFAEQGKRFKANWKNIIGFGFFVLFVTLVVCPIVGTLGALGLIWLVVHLPQTVKDFMNHHAIGLVCSEMGAGLIWVFCYTAYKDGKRKQQNDNEVSGV